MLAIQEERLVPSRVVHLSIDPTVAPTLAKVPADDEEGGDAGETDPDRVITNARRAKPSDGLLTTAELTELYATPVCSAYEEGLTKHRNISTDVVTYGDRVAFEPPRRGSNEPEWTSYTHYWKTVLGVIFLSAKML